MSAEDDSRNLREFKNALISFNDSPTLANFGRYRRASRALGEPTQERSADPEREAAA